MVTDGGGRDIDGEKPSEALRQVIDALIEGKAVPAAAQAALTESERANVASLARTAHLTRLTFHKPDPSPAAESAALAQAQQTLATRVPISSNALADPPPEAVGEGSFWHSIWSRLIGRGEDGEGE